LISGFAASNNQEKTGGLNLKIHAPGGMLASEKRARRVRSLSAILNLPCHARD
jgi:hypothetical protein